MINTPQLPKTQISEKPINFPAKLSTNDDNTNMHIANYILEIAPWIIKISSIPFMYSTLELAPAS